MFQAKVTWKWLELWEIGVSYQQGVRDIQTAQGGTVTHLIQFGILQFFCGFYCFFDCDRILYFVLFLR